MTTAEQISLRFGDDGQCWHDSDGISLETACDELARREYRDGWGTDTMRWIFADGSVITAAGAGWDLGYPECYCWRGAGHDDRQGGCTARADVD